MHGTYEQNRTFADNLGDPLTRIITSNLGVIASVQLAADVTDRRAGADYRVTLSKGSDVLVRIRRYATYKDLTIRSFSNGNRTELDKLQAGYGDWYLYAWTEGDERITDWMLVDLDKLRRAKLLEREWKQITNKDGVTGFIVIPRGYLRASECIAGEMHPPPKRSDCGYGGHAWHDVIEGNGKKKVCATCGKHFGRYASKDSETFPNKDVIG